jgi:alanyl-tRNA synthetase
MVAAQMESGRAADKTRRKLELDLAAYQGRELYQSTAPGPDGVRRAVRRATSGSLDELRALAQNFTAQSQAIFVATLANPPSVLLATSADSGVDAGQKLKAALAEAGGRGGGTARLAQGSVLEGGLLDWVVEKL